MDAARAQTLYRFATRWQADAVGDFNSEMPYRGLVAITCELAPGNWLAEALPRADRHSWLDVWRACEELYRRAGRPDRDRIASLQHQQRERVLVASFEPSDRSLSA